MIIKKSSSINIVFLYSSLVPILALTKVSNTDDPLLLCSGPAQWEQGWRSGESARLQPMFGPGSIPAPFHMWVAFVVGSRPCSEGFSLGSPNSNSTRIMDRHENQRRLMWLPL